MPDPPRRPDRYSVLILDVEGGWREAGREVLASVVGPLRRDFQMPVFVRRREREPAADLLELRERVQGAGGELLPPGVTVGERAREVLTVRRDLASDWLGWLRLHGEPGPRAEGAVRTLIAHAPDFGSSEVLLSDKGMDPRSARR